VKDGADTPTAEPKAQNGVDAPASDSPVKDGAAAPAAEPKA